MEAARRSPGAGCAGSVAVTGQIWGPPESTGQGLELRAQTKLLLGTMWALLSTVWALLSRRLQVEGDSVDQKLGQALAAL